MKNGFDLSKALYPEEKIVVGIPTRDAVPALDRPTMVDSQNAHFLNDDDRVLGVNYKGEARAYPIKILNWHQVVNDTLGGVRVVITFCPLCGSGMAFLAGEETHTFGVSGLLYNNNLLFFDRQGDNLWCQLEKRAICGEHKGKSLEYLNTRQTKWSTWRKKHPATQVQSISTGYVRYYDREPYTGYEKRRQIFFPVEHEDPAYHPKERVAGIQVNGVHKAYPYSELARTAGTVEDQVGGHNLYVRYNPSRDLLSITDRQGKTYPHVTLFWFAWVAFYPETGVFRAADSDPEA